MTQRGRPKKLTEDKAGGIIQSDGEEMQTTTDMIVREPQLSLTFEEARQFAIEAFKSKLFPDAKSEAQAIIKVMAGRELGISPLTALNKLFLVQDKIGMSAEVAVILLQRNGYQIGVNYDNYDNPTACEVTLIHPQKGSFTSRFTLADAQRADLLKSVAWQKYPRDLLYARALMSAARKFAPEALGGMGYTKEELENIAPANEQKTDTRSVSPSGALTQEAFNTSSESMECPIHPGKFFMLNKWGKWTHPTDEKNADGKTIWCSKEKIDKELKPEQAEPQGETIVVDLTANVAKNTTDNITEYRNQLVQGMKAINWKNADLLDHCRRHYGINDLKAIPLMSEEQKAKLLKDINELADLKIS